MVLGSASWYFQARGDYSPMNIQKRAGSMKYELQEFKRTMIEKNWVSGKLRSFGTCKKACNSSAEEL
jgi:hypothetical protein